MSTFVSVLFDVLCIDNLCEYEPKGIICGKFVDNQETINVSSQPMFCVIMMLSIFRYLDELYVDI